MVGCLEGSSPAPFWDLVHAEPFPALQQCDVRLQGLGQDIDKAKSWDSRCLVLFVCGRSQFDVPGSMGPLPALKKHGSQNG